MNINRFFQAGRKSTHGFTVVELLVVISSIIVILIALLLPALARARSLANAIVCSGNQRQIGMAMLDWANEHPSFLKQLAERHMHCAGF